MRPGACWRWHSCWAVAAGWTRRKAAAWTAKPCGTGRSWPKGSSGAADGRPAEGHRFNEHGLAGLSDRKAPGPTPRLTPEQDTEIDPVWILAEREIADGRLVAPLAGRAKDCAYIGHHLVCLPAAVRHGTVRLFRDWLTGELGLPDA